SDKARPKQDPRGYSALAHKVYLPVVTVPNCLLHLITSAKGNRQPVNDRQLFAQQMSQTPGHPVLCGNCASLIRFGRTSLLSGLH
ncbi:MAG: hypothetical protein ACU0CV_03955, partial [Sagittula sp.]